MGQRNELLETSQGATAPDLEILSRKLVGTGESGLSTDPRQPAEVNTTLVPVQPTIARQRPIAA